AERPTANAAHTLRSIASEVLTQIPSEAHADAAVPPPAPGTVPTRGRKSKQTAALLQPVPSARSKQDEPEARTERAERAERTEQAEAPAPAIARETRTQNKRRKGATAETELRKLFVLDTNVLMHDPSSLFRFEEHDVYLPMMTLEELDNHKKGMSEVARNARQVSRTLDALVAHAGKMTEGIPLSSQGNRDALGRLYFQTTLTDIEPVQGLPVGKADNQILGVVRALQKERPDRQVVLVSKDINMRIKAHALGLPAEDYFNDQ